jgi:prepilin-type N-terminal cleavage/methylation domain-containing protein
VATHPGRPKALRSIWRFLSGFTLIELLIAIAVMAVIVAIGVPYYTTMIVKAQETAAVAVVTQWPTAQALFYVDNRRYASSLDELYAGGYLIPSNSAKIGYTFEITDLTAQAPPQGGTMLAFDADLLEETWWDRLGLVKHAWADDKDKDRNKGKKNNKNKNKNVGNDGNQGANQGQPAASPSPSEGTFSGGGLGWQGYADPIGGRPRHFYTDQTKTITFAIGRRATRYDSLLGDKFYPHKDSSSGSQNSGPGSVNSGRGNPAGLPY